jgi:hypothetical protein
MSYYRKKPSIGGRLRRWGVPLLTGILLLGAWFGLVIFFVTSPRLILILLGSMLIMMLLVKFFKGRRLRRDLKLLERDPANPERHFAVARDHYFRNLFVSSRRDKLAAMRTFRNAVQLDLNLDIRKTSRIVSLMTSRYSLKPRMVRFVRIIARYAAVDFLFDEYERMGLPAEDLFLGRSRIMQFDRRQLAHIIAAYEIRLREIEAFRFGSRHEPFMPDSFEGLDPFDVHAVRRRQIDLLASFHHEVLGHLRRLYRDYQHM